MCATELTNVMSRNNIFEPAFVVDCHMKAAVLSPSHYYLALLRSTFLYMEASFCSFCPIKPVRILDVSPSGGSSFDGPRFESNDVLVPVDSTSLLSSQTCKSRQEIVPPRSRTKDSNTFGNFRLIINC
ncbi:hypothetical protein EG68_03824 [Paragonimus skrjabini miyazakii]|uniref:Uncharacterized protein n=1 Tax=Paragonimus skrjabini miyazakii TaxID=59628 RepID=A0A8S9Y916_9TREM|nr:hypothetical protein EG68_03824 [Paragonimus skrjabini miyazakii]